MQLITILLVAVAILTILTGSAVLFGSTKRSRAQCIWFFISTLGAAFWSIAIAAFLNFPESSANFAPALVTSIIAGITLTDVALLGYTSWHTGQSGKILTTVFALGGIAITWLLATTPSLFYDHITFGTDYNQLHVNHGWYFFLLIAYFFSISIVYSNALARSIKRVKSPGAKNGLKIFRAGLSVGGILALIFDLILITSHPGLVWIGPMAVSISIISFYYSVVKYHILALSGRWMEVLSYVILIATGIIGYILIFYLVFSALFHTPNPAPNILILNLVMSAILLCTIPALIEIFSMIRCLLPSKRIDIGYATRKLTKLRGTTVDQKELASFLAMVLRCEYVALQIDNHLYESTPSTKRRPFEIAYSADLNNSKGKTYGKIFLGHPTSHASLERWDLAQIEMIVQLTGIVCEK